LDSIRNPTGTGLALSLLLLAIPFAWPLVMYMWLRYATGHRGGVAAPEHALQGTLQPGQIPVWGEADQGRAIGGSEARSWSLPSSPTRKGAALLVVVFLAGVALTAIALAPSRPSSAAVAPTQAPKSAGPAVTPKPVTGTRGDVPFDVYYARVLTDAQRQWCSEQPFLVADALEEFQLIGFDQWDGETWNGDTAAFEQTGNYTSGCSVAWYRHEHPSLTLLVPTSPFGALPYQLTLPDDWIGATNAADWAKAVVAYDDAHTRLGATKLAADSPDRTWPGKNVERNSFVALRVERNNYAFGALLIFSEASTGRTTEATLNWWEENGADRFYAGATPWPFNPTSIKQVDLPFGPAVELYGRSEDIGSEPSYRTMYVIPAGGLEYVVVFQLSASSDLEPADTLRVVESFRMRAG
jgi:hypothetical protein